MEGGRRDLQSRVRIRTQLSGANSSAQTRFDLTAQHARPHRRQRAGLRERRTLRATPAEEHATRRGRGTQPAPGWLRPARCRRWRLKCVFVHRSIRNPQLGSSSLLATSRLSHRVRSPALVRTQGSSARRFVSPPGACRGPLHRGLLGAKHQAHRRGRWPHSRAQARPGHSPRSQASASRLPHRPRQRAARAQRSPCCRRARARGALTAKRAPSPPGEAKPCHRGSPQGAGATTQAAGGVELPPHRPPAERTQAPQAKRGRAPDRAAA